MKPKPYFLKISFIIILFISLANRNHAVAQNNLRSITELTADTSGLEILNNAIKIARNKFEILPADEAKAKEALYQTQVTTRSPMGAIIYFTGGILIDNGWIRILGSGSDKLTRSLPGWNKGKTFNDYGEQPKFLLIADDAVGGFFAVNGGAFGTDLGKIYYLAPDRLKWEAQNITYTEFINFCFVGDMNQYYDDLRWPEWQKDMPQMTADKGFYIYPFLWTTEGKDILKDKRSIVPIGELYTLETDAIKQLSK